MLHYGRGIIAPENITSIPVNATSYCVRHFRNLTEIQADMDDQDAILEELGCTPSDLSILNVKYQTSILRIALCVVVTMLCWGNQPLLKSWAYAYAIFIMITLGGLMTQSEYLKGSEKFSLIAMLVLILATNRRGRQGRVKLDIDEGLFNLVLFILVVFMSIIISTLGLVVGIEELTTFSVDDVTPGGKALWYMTVVDEYSILMVIGAFALFFFDEGRKRVSIVLYLLSICHFLDIFVLLTSTKCSSFNVITLGTFGFHELRDGLPCFHTTSKSKGFLD